MGKANDFGAVDNNFAGIFIMTAGIAVISVKDAFSKILVVDYPPVQIVSLSAWLSIVVLLLWSVRSKHHRIVGTQTFKTKHWRDHMIRSGISVISAIFFLYSLRYLRLADVTVIFFFAPVLMTAFSAFFLLEAVGKPQWFAVLFGFVGVVIAMQPDAGNFDWKVALPLAASVTYAIQSVLVRRMAGIESATQIVFHTRLGVGLLTSVPLFLYWQPMALSDFSFLIALTLLQLVAHIMITKSTVTASLAVVGPFEYTALIWATLLGYFIWGEIPTSKIWLGAFFIIGAGLLIMYCEALSKKGLRVHPSKSAE
jgi:drug/metabolite transporter (DMT)-like permease